MPSRLRRRAWRTIAVVVVSGAVLAAAYVVVTRRLERISLQAFYESHRVERHPAPAPGPLLVDADNPRYFNDGHGRTVVLAGSHTWLNFQDGGHGDPPPPFAYDAYLDYLNFYGHNFFRLWEWEVPRWAVYTSDSSYWFAPQRWQRTGPGTAEDGKPRFDLDKFDEAYFQRLRARCDAAGKRGIYVSIMLFDAWSVSKDKAGWNEQNPWRSHPFRKTNNINGVDGDFNGDDSGEDSHELHDPLVWKYQEAYIRKVIDTVGDLDNVLYEVSNESEAASRDWQYRVIETIKQYESTKPKRHPVGMTSYVGTRPAVNNQDLLESAADWISPNAGPDREFALDPPAATGAKVSVLDTDHIWGIGGDRTWMWKAFTRGHNILFMDGFDGINHYGIGGAGWERDKPQLSELRRNVGYMLSFAARLDLAAMTPQNGVCSTGYCLTTRAGAESPQYLVFKPSAPGEGAFIVDLTGARGTMDVEWFSPETGETRPGATVAGGARHGFQPPFAGDAVLYIHLPAALSAN